MNPELKELAERAGLSKAINHPSCQMWEGLDAELAEFAALVIERAATEWTNYDEYDFAQHLRDLATRWRSFPPTRDTENV